MRAVLLLAVIAVGCGKKGGGGNDSAPTQQPITPAVAPSTSRLVDTKASLPACDSTRGGQLAYVKGESKFYGCDGTEWGEISIKGEAGAAGSDNHVVTSFYCQKHLDVNISIDFTHYYVYYWASVTNYGDVVVTASVNGDTSGISATKMYAKSQVGADNGEILVQDDAYGSADGGHWTINLGRGNLTYGDITYEDTMSGGSRVWHFISTDCTKTTN